VNLETASPPEGNSHSGVWTCGGSKYACDPSLCDSKNFTIPAAKLVTNAALRADVANLTCTATATATATAAATCPATQAPGEKQCGGNEGISTAGAVGIGVGVGAPFAMATALLLTLLVRAKRQAKPPNTPQLDAANYPHRPAHGDHGPGDVNRKDAPSSEIMGTPRHEMGT
ncbi:hypothetical protein E4U53_004689, partial [Claviceps sorghi]